MGLYVVEKSPSARSTCRGCKGTIDQGELRFGNRGTGETKSTAWRHIACVSERIATNVFQQVNSVSELEGYSTLTAAEKKVISDRILPPAAGEAEVKTPAKKQRSPSPAPASKSKKAKK